MLHGEIKVNYATIGAWTAVRQSSLTGVDKVYEYKCELLLNDKHYEGIVSHKYSDGAAALVAKIMGLTND